MPKAGGDYVYLSRGLSPVFGFLFGWTRSMITPLAKPTRNIPANSNSVPTRGADGFPLPHPEQARRRGHGCGV
jgi:hypothetical protein